MHCLTCLLEFGCLTAGHHCPCCERGFEFRPELWRKASPCPNGKARGKAACGVRFKVMHFKMSKGQQASFGQQLRDEEAERKRREASATARDARSQAGVRAAARGDDGDGDEFDEELGQFIVTEDCPRCGKQFETGHAAHLRKCKGTKGNKGTAVAKRKRGGGGGGGGGGGAWLVGSDQKDTLYREPKGTKGSGSATKVGAAKKARAPAAEPAGTKAKAASKAKAAPKAKAKDSSKSPRKKPKLVAKARRKSRDSSSSDDHDDDSDDDYEDN